MKFPFEELNMRDQEHVDWVKSQRDPELWHAAAIAIVNTVGDPHGFLVWLADQPETDRATAGYFFLGDSEPTICAERPIFAAKDCLGSSGFAPWSPYAGARRPSASQMIRWVFSAGSRLRD
jgi:hypothetical protein